MEYYPRTKFERGLLAGVNMTFDAMERNMGVKGASAGGAPAAPLAVAGAPAAPMAVAGAAAVQAVPLRPQPYYGPAQPQLAPAHYANMVFPGFMPQPFTVPTTRHPAQFPSPALVGSGGQRQQLQARGLGVRHAPGGRKSVALVQDQQARGAGGAPRGASSGSHGARMTQTQLGSIRHDDGGGGGGSGGSSGRTASSGRSGSGKGSGGRSGSGNHAHPRHSSVPKPGSSHPATGATAQAGGKRQHRGAGLQQVAQPDKRHKQGGH